ncbi:7657_t:CDS:2, partial [Acaulospora colombiana]
RYWEKKAVSLLLQKPVPQRQPGTNTHSKAGRCQKSESLPSKVFDWEATLEGSFQPG